MYNQCDVSNECNDEDSTLDSWSFPTSLSRFSVKKIKSRLGRRKLTERSSSTSTEDLKQNVNSAFWTSKDNLENAISNGSHHDDSHPIHSSGNDESSEVGSPDSGTGTVTENEISKFTLNSTSISNISHSEALMKTPCTSFYMQDFTFGSPLDPLAGILNSNSPVRGKRGLSEQLECKSSMEDTHFFSPESQAKERKDEEPTEFFSLSAGTNHLNESFLSNSPNISSGNEAVKTERKILMEVTKKCDDSGISGPSPPAIISAETKTIFSTAATSSSEMPNPVERGVIKCEGIENSDSNLETCLLQCQDLSKDFISLSTKSPLDQAPPILEAKNVISTSVAPCVDSIEHSSCKNQSNQKFPFASVFSTNYKQQNAIDSSNGGISSSIKKQTGEHLAKTRNVGVSNAPDQTSEGNTVQTTLNSALNSVTGDKSVGLDKSPDGESDSSDCSVSKPVISAASIQKNIPTHSQLLFQNSYAPFQSRADAALDPRFQKPLTATHGKTLHPAAFLKDSQKHPLVKETAFVNVGHNSKPDLASSAAFSSGGMVSAPDHLPVSTPKPVMAHSSANSSSDVKGTKLQATSSFSTPAAWSSVSKPVSIPQAVGPTADENYPLISSTSTAQTSTTEAIKYSYQSAFTSQHSSATSSQSDSLAAGKNTISAGMPYNLLSSANPNIDIRPGVSCPNSDFSHPASNDNQATKPVMSANNTPSRQFSTLPTAFPTPQPIPVVSSVDQPVKESNLKPLSSSLKENRVSNFSDDVNKIPNMPSSGVSSKSRELPVCINKDQPLTATSGSTTAPSTVEGSHLRNPNHSEPQRNFIHQPSLFGDSQKIPRPEIVRSKSLNPNTGNESHPVFSTQSHSGGFRSSIPSSQPFMNRVHSSDNLLNRQNLMDNHQVNSSVDPKSRPNIVSHHSYPFKLQEGVGSSSLFGPYPSENKENLMSNINRLGSHCDMQSTFKRPFQPPPPQLKYGQVNKGHFQNSQLPPKVSSPSVYVNGHAYTPLSILGKGGSSVVYQVVDEETDTAKLKAVKRVDLSSVESSIADGYLNEINLLHKLQECDSVIKMFDFEYLKREKILYVVMEKGDTDFARLIKDITVTKKISTSMIIYYWTEMLNAVRDIHERGIIHSDLKPANFLLVSGRLKLIDFGIASSLQGDMTSVIKDAMSGTFNYMSPEALTCNNETQRGAKISYRSDIWSLGCILYNLVYGKTPYSHIGHVWARANAIKDPGSAPKFPPPDGDVPTALSIALRWCLKKNPRDRPTARQLLQLPYYGPPVSTDSGQRVRAETLRHTMEMFPDCNVDID